MSSTGTGPDNVARFKSWLTSNGGSIHTAVHFEPAQFGFNVVAKSDIPLDTPVIAIPFSLAITPDIATHALKQLLNTNTKAFRWNERQLECTYIALHWILDPVDSSVLRHRPYLDLLPSPENLRTPLHFTEKELAFFKGSNIFGATLDRRREWEAEWKQCQDEIPVGWGQGFTWEMYLTAATYLSSRAFPSTILSEMPSLVTTEGSYPVLLPGIDSLNHARGHPVSWVVSLPLLSLTSEPSISLVIHAPTPRGSELFNNYGLKPNSELILGYGFSLPNNPDDTIVLKIGGSSAQGSSRSTSPMRGWEVGRNARGAGPVWEAVLSAVRGQRKDSNDDYEEVDTDTIEDELCAADMLAEMAQQLHGRLPPFPTANVSEIRPEVLKMLEHYLEGQRDILQSLVTFAQEKEKQALESAKEQGLDVIDEKDQQND